VTAAEQLQTFVKRLRERGIKIVIAKAQLPLRQSAIGLGLKDAFSEENYFPKLSEAVVSYERRPSSQK
jgi:hypothetical protein